MGLLDYFGNMNEDQAKSMMAAASQILQGAGNPNRPFGLGQAAGVGMETYQAQSDAMRRRKQQEAEQAQMQQMRTMQLMQMQGSMQDQQAARQQSGIDQAAIRSAFAPYGSRPADMSPTIENAAKLGTTPQFDPRAFLASNPQISMAGLKGAMEMNASFNPSKKLKTTTDETVDGKTVKVNWFEDGSHQIVNGMLPRTKMEIRSAGGHDYAFDPYAVKDGQTFKHSATIGEGLQGQRLQFDKQQAGRPQFNAEVGGFISPPREGAPNGTLTPLIGINKSSKMTEDQSKAAGWLVQAENAFKNMRSVAIDSNGAVKSAAKPGFNDAVANIPSLGVGGAIANTFRSSDRQKFMQGASSLSEALLRAATGAGVNKEESEQKIRELTPVMGDSDETIQQKFDAIPLYIESLKMRAGPGAAMASSIGSKPVATGGWSITRN